METKITQPALIEFREAIIQTAREHVEKGEENPQLLFPCVVSDDGTEILYSNIVDVTHFFNARAAGKDALSAKMKEMIESKDVPINAVVLISEMWFSKVNVDSLEEANRGGVIPSKDPNRQEGFVVFTRTATETETRTFIIDRDKKTLEEMPGQSVDSRF